MIKASDICFKICKIVKK